MNKTPIYLITSYLCCFTVVISAPIILELSTLTSDKGISIWSAVTGDNMGCSISGTGDINQDGINDFIIGAKKGVVSSSSNPEGYAYVIFGSKNGLSNIDLTTPLAPSQGFKITGGNAGDAFGYSVAGIGDYNADGILDFAVGANTADATTSASLNVGHAYILFGQENWGSPPIGALRISTISPTSPGFRVEGEESNGNLATVMSIAGDVNGDGIIDMIIGAYNEDYGGTAAGCVYVIYGRKDGIQNLVVPSDLTSDRGFKILGPLTNQIGRDISAAGDFNGDGIDDIAIGAPSVQATGIGLSYIIFGRKGVRPDIILGNGLNGGEGVTIIGANPGDAFGVAVSSAGDFNDDGYEDVLMGAYHANSNGETNSGAAYVFLGNKNSGSTINLSQGLKRNQGFQIEAIRANEELGYTLSSAGDVNGDGVNDILVGGLPPTALNFDGVIYVIYGRKTGIQDINLANGLNENEGFTIKRTGDKFVGYAFSNAGDVSGDGIDDILIGEYHNSGRGGATVIFGVKFPGIELLQAAVMAQGIITQAAQGLAKLFMLLNSGNAGALFFSALFGLLQYMKYMNIQYPPKLDYILSQPGPDFISIPCISSAPDSVENAVPSYTLPVNFEKYNIPSSFLINQWSSLITLIIVIIAIVLSCLATYLTSNCKYINLACSKLKQAVKWNYLLAMFTGGFGDIAFYTSLEMRTTNFESFLEGFSFVICVFMNIAVVVVSILIMFILRQFVMETKRNKNNRKARKTERMKDKFKDFQILFKGFSSESFLNQSYLLIFSLRLYFFNSVLVYLFDYPIIQAVIINFQGLAFFFYLVLKRPIKEKLDFIGAIAQEFIFQMVHTCVLNLAIMDHMDVDISAGSRVAVGNIIIICSLIFAGVGLIYILILFIGLLRDALRYLGKRSSPSARASTGQELAVVTRNKASRYIQGDLQPSQSAIHESQKIKNNDSSLQSLNDSIHSVSATNSQNETLYIRKNVTNLPEKSFSPNPAFYQGSSPIDVDKRTMNISRLERTNTNLFPINMNVSVFSSNRHKRNQMKKRACE